MISPQVPLWKLKLQALCHTRLGIGGIGEITADNNQTRQERKQQREIL
jgi:hypothetical protein